MTYLVARMVSTVKLTTTDLCARESGLSTQHFLSLLGAETLNLLRNGTGTAASSMASFLTLVNPAVQGPAAHVLA